jgi:hypothetical protein
VQIGVSSVAGQKEGTQRFRSALAKNAILLGDPTTRLR